MKMLFVDIETAPALAYVWGLYNQDVGISQLVEPVEVMCFAAKWADDRHMHFHSAHAGGRTAMVGAAHALLDAADVVVHYNGTKFDVPHLQREILLAGLAPPSPFAQLDLFRVVRRRFHFTSSKLSHVAAALGLKGKVAHEGFALWRKCLAGDAAAWRRMERYNRRDVRLVEELYEILRPWAPAHPNRALYDGTSGCPVCGAEKLWRQGHAYTRVSKFQRWQCTSCGSWFRSTKRDEGTAIQGVAP